MDPPRSSEIPDAWRDDVRSIARSFDVPDREIVAAPRQGQGQVNLTVFLGDDFALRLPRKPPFAERLAKEAAVIPLVSDWGIPTAKVVRFDAERKIAGLPCIVLERLHGETIDDLPELTSAAEPLLGSLSRLLAALHRIRPDQSREIVGMTAGDFSRDDLFDELVTAGEIGASQATWLTGWFARLESAGALGSDLVFLHGDVMPSNLILDESGRVGAIIDWGSARWGERARDLAGFRSSQLPAVVDSYRAAAHGGADAAEGGSALELEAGVLWYQLFFALSKLLGRTSTSEPRNWSAPRVARLLELLRFVADGLPPRWSSLLEPGGDDLLT